MTDATKSTNPAQGSAMPKPSETHSKRICTIVGFSAVALGAVTLLVGASETVWEMRWFVLKLVGLFMAVAAVVLSLFWCAFELHRHRPKAAVLVFKTLAAALVAGAVVLVVPGWVRFFGFPANGLAPLGSLSIGLGGLAFGFGLVALAWCMVPLENDGSRGNKIFVSAMFGMLTLFMPGLLAAEPPKPRATAPTEATAVAPVPTAQPKA